MVPKWLQTALWDAYREGQEVDKKPSLKYLAVQGRIRLFLADVEDNDEGRGRAGYTWLLALQKSGVDLAAFKPEDLLIAFDAQLQEKYG